MARRTGPDGKPMRGKRGPKPGPTRVEDTVRIPKDLMLKLDGHVRKAGEKSRSAVYVKAIRAYVEGRKRTTVDVPWDLFSKILHYAKAQKRTVDSVLLEAVEYAWKRRKHWPSPTPSKRRPG